jgi:hypothetical protein
VGAPLLVLGFIGQGVAAEATDWSMKIGARWWLALILLPLAWLATRWRRHVVFLQTIEARLYSQIWDRAIVVDAYERALRQPGEPRGRGKALSAVFGELYWSGLQDDLRREREIRKNSTNWLPPLRRVPRHWDSLVKWRRWFLNGAIPRSPASGA